VANYQIMTRKGKLGISAGFRISSYTSGYYSYKIKTSYGGGINPDFLYEKNVDPFSEDLFVPAKRSRSQLVLGSQYSLGPRCTASVSYSVGAGLTFTEPYSGSCSTGATHHYHRGDIGISVRYQI
jgi:hypothetical protein